MAAIERVASAVWEGDLKGGKGKIDAASGVLQGVSYTYAQRFENTPGTNPEELIAAAHAACFSMFFANQLSKAGFKVNSIDTKATVSLENVKVTHIKLETVGNVEGVDEMKFQDLADFSKQNCPISVALSAVPTELIARLVK
jgi:lipoyl-dependent peroxiredoxin